MHRPLLLASAAARQERDAGDHGVWDALTVRETLPYVLGLFCVVGGVLALYFHTQYREESQRAVRTESELRGQIATLNQSVEELHSRGDALDQALQQTKAALVAALRPEVSTRLPTPKDAALPPRR